MSVVISYLREWSSNDCIDCDWVQWTERRNNKSAKLLWFEHNVFRSKQLGNALVTNSIKILFFQLHPFRAVSRELLLPDLFSPCQGEKWSDLETLRLSISGTTNCIQKKFRIKKRTVKPTAPSHYFTNFKIIFAPSGAQRVTMSVCLSGTESLSFSQVSLSSIFQLS